MPPAPNRLQVDVFNAVRAPVAPAFIRSTLHHAVELAEVAARLPEIDCSVAMRLTSGRELWRLNRTYAGIDSTTDVLSFAGTGSHLGDIAISWPMVVQQAKEFGHPEQTEVALLSVHGLLHLLGWDHAGADERREMNRLTVAALKVAGLKVKAGRL